MPRRGDVDLPLRSPINQRHGGFRGLCSTWKSKHQCLWRRLQDSRPLGSVRASREERTRLLISVTVSAAACDPVPTHLPMGSETLRRGSTQVDRRERVRHSGVHRRFPVPPSVSVTMATTLSVLCSTAGACKPENSTAVDSLTWLLPA